MEHFYKNHNEDRHRIEQIVLIAYVMYCLNVIGISVQEKWQSWIMLFIVVSAVASILLCLFQYKDYKFRACFTGGMLGISTVLYSVNYSDVRAVAPVLMLVVVVLGLYEIKEVISISVAVTTFLLLYFFVFNYDYTVSATAGNFRGMLIEICMTYVIEAISYYRVYRQINKDEINEEIIEMLEDAQNSKDDFLANVSHEIRTPINTICGMSEIVLRGELSDKLREEVFDIQTAGKNLLSIVSDILDFSELSSGKMDIVEDTYNITSTINNVLNMLVARQNSKNIEIVVDCDVNIPCGLIGDEQKIRRIIMNLLDNALKFTNEGGIELAVSHRKTEYGVNLLVTVSDTGIGMKEESIEKLFTSFSQVDTRRNRQEGGLGLGLAISKALVDKMGGFITVKSEMGKGTVIQFAIPQKVADETPIITVDNPDNINVAVWISLEQIHYREIRDKYNKSIEHMIEQLRVRCSVCRSLGDLKRKSEWESFTHIFITTVEYNADREYFDELSEHVKIIIVIDRWEEKELYNDRLYKIYKPFYSLPVVLAFNNEEIGLGARNYSYESFTAPAAKVLLVDDNLMNIKVIEGLLKIYEVQIVTAASGMEAIEKIESADYDIVFMDHMMPEMDGIEALKRIREKKGKFFKAVPIVALTANAIGGMREVFLNEGFQDFVPKPVDAATIGRTLLKFVSEDKVVYNKTEAGQEQAADDIHDETVEAAAVAENKSSVPVIGELDVSSGVLYCGNFDNYIEILRLNYNKGEDNKAVLRKYYEAGDWAKYTIHVHGLKSAMASIGAGKLSDMAKQLESAAKKADVEYILANHDKMMAEYERVLSSLRENELVNPKTAGDVGSDLEEISPMELDRITAELEQAVYTFDADAMLGILDKLNGFAYKGHALEKELLQVRGKVEMTDFISAYELFVRMKDGWNKAGR